MIFCSTDFDADDLDQINQEEQPADYAEMMTSLEFKEACDAGAYTDDDGSGYYVGKDGRDTTIQASPSDFRRGIINPNYSIIRWYNK